MCLLTCLHLLHLPKPLRCTLLLHCALCCALLCCNPLLKPLRCCTVLFFQFLKSLPVENSLSHGLQCTTLCIMSMCCNFNIVLLLLLLLLLPLQLQLLLLLQLLLYYKCSKLCLVLTCRLARKYMMCRLIRQKSFPLKIYFVKY